MSFRPLNDMVLVHIDAAPEQRGSIIMPTPDNAPLRRGTVLRVGPGRRKLVKASGTETVYVPTQVQPGDRVVFFSAAAGSHKNRLPTEALEENEVLLHEEDILFVLEEDVEVEL
jgi:co-chaperonin GroES (HSP10)